MLGRKKKLLEARYQSDREFLFPERDFSRTGRLQSETVAVMGRYIPPPGLLTMQTSSLFHLKLNLWLKGKGA